MPNHGNPNVGRDLDFNELWFGGVWVDLRDIGRHCLHGSVGSWRCRGAFPGACMNLQPTVLGLSCSRWRSQSQTVSWLDDCLFKGSPGASWWCTKHGTAIITVQNKHYIFSRRFAAVCVFAVTLKRICRGQQKDSCFLWTVRRIFRGGGRHSSRRLGPPHYIYVYMERGRERGIMSLMYIELYQCIAHL